MINPKSSAVLLRETFFFVTKEMREATCFLREAFMPMPMRKQANLFLPVHRPRRGVTWYKGRWG